MLNKDQIQKILKVCIVATAIMFACEIVFSINAVNDFFKNLITNSNGIAFYAILFAIMFLQVTILNIPAYVILSASVSIGINCLSWQYLLTVICAYMLGCILAYWLGRWFGAKAVRWCAGSEEDFTKWCNAINSKGKWWYFATVIFPLFPDDLLCLVAGSVKFNFAFYCFANLIGRSVGLIAMILTLQVVNSVSGGFPIMLVVWGIALVAEIIALIVINRKKDLTNE